VSRTQSALFWVISVVIMLGIVVYQKTTGPTYPEKGERSIYGIEIDYSLPRSNDGSYTVDVFVVDKSKELSGSYKIRRYKSHDEWKQLDMERAGDTLWFIIPHQPAAGKVQYQIFLTKDDRPFIALTEVPVILRFRDEVPALVLIFHLIFIFTTITLSTRTAFETIFGGKRKKLFIILTIISLILGGFIFGPIMQKYAFGEFWTGWPFGHDLTDNKTLIIFIFWIIAFWVVVKKPENKIWPVIAAVVLIVIYLIPHSLLGSELDYRKIESQRDEKILE
jgi:hypothetical protein